MGRPRRASAWPSTARLLCRRSPGPTPSRYGPSRSRPGALAPATAGSSGTVSVTTRPPPGLRLDRSGGITQRLVPSATRLGPATGDFVPCPADQALTASGTYPPVPGHCDDNSGNTATALTPLFKVDSLSAGAFSPSSPTDDATFAAEPKFSWTEAARTRTPSGTTGYELWAHYGGADHKIATTTGPKTTDTTLDPSIADRCPLNTDIDWWVKAFDLGGNPSARVRAPELHDRPDDSAGRRPSPAARARRRTTRRRPSRGPATSPASSGP